MRAPISPDLLRRVGRWQGRSETFGSLVEVATRPLRNRTLRVRYGVNAGLHFNSFGANLGYVLGTTEPEVQAFLAAHLRPGETFYDLGANVGFFTVLGARAVGPTGHVYALEPLPENVAGLRRNIARNAFEHVTVIAAAVAETRGQATLQLYDKTSMAKIETPETPTFQASRRPRTTVEVDQVALDDLVGHDVAPPDVIKMDIEGSEVQAIRGLEQTLARHAPLIVCALHGTNAQFEEIMSANHYRVTELGGDRPASALPWNATVVATPTRPPTATRGPRGAVTSARAPACGARREAGSRSGDR